MSKLPRPGDVLGDAAEVSEHLVGEDDRDRDRDQRLAQILALVPAQEELLHHQAHAATSRVPTIAGTIQWVRLTWLLDRPNAPPCPTRSRWSFSAM